MVSKGNEELASSESVELVISPFLLELAVSNLLCLSGLIDSLDELVDVVVRVEVVPHDFSVVGIVATTVALLGTIVEEGDTSSGQGEGKSTLEESLVVIAVKESCIVMVVYEDAKSVNVFEVLSFFVPSVGDASHGLSVHEGILDGIVHWVVEHASKMVLVITNVGRVAIETLSHLEDSGCLAILGPEILGNFRNSVDSNTVEIILLDKILDPVLQVLTHIGVALI